MFKKKARWISFSLFLIGVCSTFVLEKIFEFNRSIELNVGILIWVTVLAFGVIIWILVTYKDYIDRLKSEQKTLMEEKERLLKEKSNIIGENKKYKEMVNNAENSVLMGLNSEGIKYLLMALSQDLYEPLRIELLKRAAYDYHNLIAVIILAATYKKGLVGNGKIIVDKDIEEAYRLYFMICEEDQTGIIDWLLGLMYQTNQIEDAKNLSEEKRYETARKYFESSEQKGYPKAINSLGNFYKKGLGGLKRDESLATAKYIKAAEYDDPYAILNCGHHELACYDQSGENENLKTASEYFERASKYNSSEAWLYLGIVNEQYMLSDSSRLNDVKNYYLKSIENVTNQFSAMSLYRLGSLIGRYPGLQNDINIREALSPIKYNDLRIECYTRSYQIFQNIIDSGNVLSNKYQECFDKLVDGFNSID